MAQPTVPRARRRQVVMKPESVYGTDIFAGTYVAADVMPAENIQLSKNIAEIETLSPAGLLGRGISAIGTELGSVSWTQKYRGKATGTEFDDSPEVVAEFDRPMRGCGHARTFGSPGVAGSNVKYAPGAPEAMTIYVQLENGACVKLTGCFGTFGFTMRAGMHVEFRFQYFGILAGIADVSYVAGTFAATPGYPVAKSAAFQIGTENYAPRIAEVRFDQGNAVLPLPSINAVGGVGALHIADRNPRLTIDPEAATVATYAWYTKWIAGTLADCTFQAGTTDLNTLLMNFPKLQVVGQQDTERDGIVAYQTVLLATINAGDDDYDFTTT